LDKVEIPGSHFYVYRLCDDGVFRVYDNKETMSSVPSLLRNERSIDNVQDQSLFPVPNIKEYFLDNDLILSFISDGPTKSFAFRRLRFLESQFTLYAMLNEYKEMAAQKAVPHRDFYNVRKVDTHVHHSSSMNLKHLLRFIKSTMKRCPEVG
jgi:AMP deaminase